MDRYFLFLHLHFFSTSPQFIFGVDAAPAALIGAALLNLNIESGSKEALSVVPQLTFLVAVLLMLAGAVMTRYLLVETWGVHTLSKIEPGLPVWKLPDLSLIPMKEAITISLSVAVVIMAETLLAENNFAQKNGYAIDDNREILAFSMGNLIASLTGCCPINGSVSRTAMGEQYQSKTQLTGIVAGLSMIVVLLGGTGFIGYLPVPVLTAIVISALLGATEFELAARLWKVSRTEFFIFVGAFVGVLMLGAINGVLILRRQIDWKFCTAL